jgi:pimeloyl-ACP methyl ester carboxylesterase
MSKLNRHLTDLRGASRLAIDATKGLVDLVEAMHQSIAGFAGVLGKPGPGRTRGISGFVYRTIRGTTGLVGGGIDAVLARLLPLLDATSSSRRREVVLAALNGVLGDYLAATSNPLAIPMRLRRNGRPLQLSRQALAGKIGPPSARVVILVHGLCVSDLQWQRKGHDHGAALARDLGYTPVYLHYNTGLHVSSNGRAFAGLIEVLLEQWPVTVKELVIIGHSMGGLVARSACRYGALAGHDWPKRLRKLVFLGTPHHGAPLERGGHWVDVILGVSPYTAPFARLGKIRSAGVTDLRHGNLLDEDWEGHDRFGHAQDLRQPVPLPKRVQCYAIAATTGNRAGDLSDRVLGDGLVPVESALGRHADSRLTLSIPKSRQWVGYGMNHLDLLSHPEVYAVMKRWLAPGSTRTA